MRKNLNPYRTGKHGYDGPIGERRIRDAIYDSAGKAFKEDGCSHFSESLPDPVTGRTIVTRRQVNRKFRRSGGRASY